LVSSVVLKGRGWTPLFWVLADLTSLIEPVSQAAVLGVLPGTLLAAVLIEIFAVNLAQTYLFRAYGFLAAIVMRLGLYLAWHIIRGILLV